MSISITHQESINITAPESSESRGFKYTFFCFVLISLTNAILNYDNGVIPVILNWIQVPYKFSNTELGIMGALPYLGFITSSPFMSYIILNFSSKKAIICSMLLNMSSLTLFALSVNKYMFFVSRFLCGFTRALFIVYYPLWVDIFAPENHRNLWMSIIQGGIVVGITKGYIFTSLFSYAGKYGWRLSIFTQVGFEIILISLFTMVPREFIEFEPNREDNVEGEVCTCNNVQNSLSLTNWDTKRLNTNIVLRNSATFSPSDPNLVRNKTLELVYNRMTSIAMTTEARRSRIYSNFERSMTMVENPKCNKCFSNNPNECVKDDGKNLSTLSKFRLLCKQNVFMLTCLGISMVYFEVTGIHYWMTKIGVSHLNINERAVHLIFSIETIAGPVLGIVSGSYLIDQIIYHYPEQPLFVDMTLFIWGSFTCVSSVVLLLNQNPMAFIICIFIILFFGAALVPTLTLTSVAYLPHNLKPAGASFFMCQYQIFGFMMGTLVPGVVVDIFNSYTTSLCIIYLSGFVGLGAMTAIIYIKWNRIKKSKQTVNS